MKTGIISLSLLLMSLVTTQSAFGQNDEAITQKTGVGVSLFNLNQSGAYNLLNS